jgi:S1-C subfamily serine protease
MAQANFTKAHPAGSRGDASIWIVLITVLGVLASVWLVVKLANNPSERANLPEEAIMLSDFMLLPPAGPWLGINVATNRGAIRPGGNPANGAVVSRVMVGSPAFNAGIRAGDMIMRVASNPIRSPADLMSAMSKHKVDDVVPITVGRGGVSRKLHVKLGTQPMGKLAAVTQAVGRPWLGADIQGIDDLLAKRLGAPDMRGVVVSHVYPQSPAQKAGLAQGDVIRRVGEIRLRDIAQTKDLLARHRAGDILRLVVWRKGSQKNLNVTLSAVPPPAERRKPTLPEAAIEIEAAWLGLDIVPMTPAEAEELGLPAGLSGMVVDGVAAGRGVDAGFQMGDVIVAVNGKATTTVADFKEATEGAVGALVDAVRFGRHIYLSVPPPGGGAGGQQPPIQQVGLRLW